MTLSLFFGNRTLEPQTDFISLLFKNKFPFLVIRFPLLLKIRTSISCSSHIILTSIFLFVAKGFQCKLFVLRPLGLFASITFAIIARIRVRPSHHMLTTGKERRVSVSSFYWGLSAERKNNITYVKFWSALLCSGVQNCFLWLFSQFDSGVECRVVRRLQSSFTV